MEPDRPGTKKPSAKPQTPLASVKPGELPSVLRRSNDFAGKLVAPAGTTNLAASAAREDAGKQAAARGHLVSTDVAATALLPRLEPGAHHPGLPTRAPKPASPPRPGRGSLTPERARGSKAQDASRSSNDLAGAAGSPGTAGHLQATAASGAAASWRGSPASAGRQSPDVPAVGSVAMSALPASLYRKLTAEGESNSSSGKSSPSPRGDAAATGSPQAAGDSKLSRPVDPCKPGYYWKPVQGEAAAAAVREALGPAANADNVLSYQVLQEVAGQDPLSAPIAHVRQRKSMLMRLPLGTEHFLGAVPAAVQDKAGHACLLVLPSDKPSNRKEAMAVEALLAELLKDPETAVLKACQWRAAALAEMCNESLGVVAESLKLKGPPGSWQFAELNRNLTGQMLGSSMVEAVDHLISENTESAERMASLLNPREATVQVGAAAAAAVAAAAATIAPASLRSPSAVLRGMGTAAAAIHDLAETSAAAQQHQEQLQRGLQQQVAASMNRHQQQLSQIQQLDSEQQQQSPKSPGTHRSSRLAAAVDASQDVGSSPQQQQSRPQSPSRLSSAPRRSALQHSAASPAMGSDPQAAADSNGTAVEQTRVGISRESTAYRSLQVVTDAQSLSRQGSGAAKLPQQQNSSSSGHSEQQQQQPEHQLASGLPTPSTAKSRLSTATHNVNSSGGDPSPSSNGSRVRSSSKSPRRSRPGTPSTSVTDSPAPQHSPVQSPGQKPRALSPSAEHDAAVGANVATNASEGAAQPVDSDGQVVLVHQKGLDLSRLYGLALAASVCMADIVRQVEVACVERGRALIYAWNCSVGAAEEAMVELRGQNKKLLGLNSGLTQALNNIDKELKGLEFVRREAIRFRKELEDEKAQLSAATADNTRLKGRLEVADAQLEVVDSFCRKRLARLRWRNAFATLGTWSRQSVIQSGGSKEDTNQLLAKVVMLEKLANAVNAVEHRKMAYGRNQVTEKFEYNRPQMSDMVQVMTLGPQVVAPGRVHDGYNIDSTVQMLAALTPEARTMVIATMPPVQRWKVLEAMRDEERAAMVIAMSSGLRKEAAEAVDARLWERTMEVIRSHSGYASRYLTGMDIDDAAVDFQNWDIYQKVDTLSALDTYTAAALLTRTKQKERKQLLGMLEPYLAANIVQAMMPPPAASAVDSLDVNKAMAILSAMDPNKAADVLTEMGAQKAAGKLVGMEADARNSIIENMAPRDAAQTLTKMEDAIQRAQEDGTDSPELLSLTGGNLESPVMGTMTELNAANAYSILSYMSVQDKAALLASMDPAAVARLLGLMDPEEAVMLLNALGDSRDRLISQGLSCEERDRLVEVLQAADCKPKTDFSRRARKKGSFRNRRSEEDKVERLVDAYQTIAAGAMDDSIDDEPPAQSRNRATANKQAANGPAQRRPPMKSVGIQVGAYDSASGQVGAVADRLPSKAGAAAAVEIDSTSDSSSRARRSRTRTTSSVGSAADAADGDTVGATAAAAAAAGGAGNSSSSTKARGNRAAGGVGHGKGGDSKAEGGKKAAVNARRTEERVAAAAGGADASGAGEAGGGDSTAAAAAAAAGSSAEGGSKKIAAAAAGKGAGGGKAAAAAGAHGAAANKGRKAAHALDAEDSNTAAAGGGKQSDEAKQRSSQIGAVAAAGSGSGVDDGVPRLVLSGGNEEFEGDGSSPPSSARKVKILDEDSGIADDAPSSDNIPQAAAGAATSRSTVRSNFRTTATVAASAAAGRKALKEALKSQATGKKVQRPSTIGAAVGGIGAILKEASQFAAGADDDSISDGASTYTATTPASEAHPQQRLGRVPKNARLIEAMAQHKNAKPKPKGWLMAVVDSIYKEGETLLRKLGRSDMIKKQSVPEIVFAFFHNKYGQRALVNENVGSLVNTLTLYQRNDLRLEAFARLLSEEWDVSIFLDFLNAQNMCMQPAKMACIEYPREASKDEQYPWVCLYKAVWVADSVLGMRAQAARDRFIEFLHMTSVPADEADVERLRRERREAAAKDPTARQQEELPETFFKLPRIRFLLILCKEICRINKFISSFGEDKFTAMDVNRTDKIDIVLVRSFVKTTSPGVGDAQVSDNISSFVSLAEAAARDISPEQVSVPSVTELSREAFVAGVSSTMFVREHVKMHLLTAARLEEDDSEAQVFFNLLSVLIMRHSAALMPVWQAVVDAAGDRGRPLQQQLGAVTAAGSGDARLKAYISLLLALMNTATQSYLSSLLSNETVLEALDPDQLEDGLVRLEDAALILVDRCNYLLDDGTNKDLAAARMARLPLNNHMKVLGLQLLRHRHMKEGMVVSAALVMQRTWLRRQKLRQQQ